MFFDELPNFDKYAHDIKIRVSMLFEKALGGLQEPFVSLRCDDSSSEIWMVRME